MTKKKVQLVSMIGRETRRAIDREKRRRGMSLSAIVEAALVRYFAQSAGPRCAPETK